MRLESIKDVELCDVSECELPKSHIEGLDRTLYEHMGRNEWLERIGERIFVEIVESQPGVGGRFREISREGTRKEFVRYYTEYIKKPKRLREQFSEIYEFLRDYIFLGREYFTSENEEVEL